MGNRRKSSSDYPQEPQQQQEHSKGERKDERKKGRFARHGENQRQKGSHVNQPSHSGAVKRSNRKPQSPSRRDLPVINSDDQITDGKFRGKRIRLSDSPRMSATTWRLRETLFRILFKRIRAKSLLDLCAGAGGVGIGALSRGALLVSFLDRKAKNCSLIRENLKSLSISEGHGEIFEEELLPFLKKMAKRRRFWDIVYFAPPYDFDYDEALDQFKRGCSIKRGGLFVIEHHSEMFFPETLGVLRRWKIVVEGESALSFYDRV